MNVIPVEGSKRNGEKATEREIDKELRK